ncbi:hypothetical protein NBT05_03490 [Aquimarina sp. ERC-38]|uniref:hypothetical protein n=1 Tax=Aquimarina sp. ERC-38 TaxID=2949996 RepID=UPI0022456418|nr:hypothetical protein [Aquimarina sp. ERC-38]UZO81544.1 hypothetical protein NBT05_03490 [Aquimarina sp. ERC-38]
MDEKRIEEIVQKVFEKAEKEQASHTKFALSKHISNQTTLSSKTLERTYDRYINKKSTQGPPTAYSVDLLCKYLGFENYLDYVKNNPIREDKIIDDEEKNKTQNGHQQKNKNVNTFEKEEGSGKKNEEEKKSKRIITLSISIALGVAVLVFIISNWPKKSLENDFEPGKCMTWAETKFVSVSCDMGPYSEYGTKVEPLRKATFKNMRKVKVDAAYQFFAKDGSPLIWYYKNKDKEYEFFTAPGLHPTTNKTLKKITPYIIEKHVPVHTYHKSSFIQQGSKLKN